MPVWPLLLGIAAGVSLGAAVACSGNGGASQDAPPSEQPSHPIAFYDEHTFAGSLEQAESVPVQPMPGVRALVIPHHWRAGYLILRGMRDLTASGDFNRVILVGPDHVDAGSTPASTSRLAWSTPFGLLQPDTPTIEQLIALGVVGDDPDVVSHDHSVAGIVHAVAYYMPEARVVPIVLRHNMTDAQLSALAAAVAQVTDEDTAVIAAVDFSHYLAAPQAEQKDQETLSALERLDANAILAFSDDHTDSPESVAFAMLFSQLRGGAQFVLRENTNSGVLSGTLSPPVTSYIAGYFTAP